MSKQHQPPKPPCVLPAPTAGAAYRLTCIRVNCRRAVAFLAAGSLVAAWASAGCVSSPATAWEPSYLIACRFQPDGAAADGPALPAGAQVPDQLARLGSLGFNGLVVSTSETPEAELKALQTEAAGMGIVLVEGETPEAARKVRWGIGDPSPSSPHPVAAARGIPLGFSAPAQRRSLDWRRQESRVVRIPSPGDRGGGIGVLGLLRIGQASDPTASQTGQLLRQYHESLAQGRTGGLLLEDAGRGPLIAIDSPDPARTSALQLVLGRAQAWGPRLHDLEARTLSPPEDWPDDGRIVLFVGGDRRYLLIFNASVARYLRRAYAFPAADLPPAAVRAVQVPTTPTGLPGQVKEGSQGRIHLALELRPGDAVLYELFHQTDSQAATHLPEPRP